MSDPPGLGLLAAGSLEFTGCQWGDKSKEACLLWMSLSLDELHCPLGHRPICLQSGVAVCSPQLCLSTFS